MAIADELGVLETFDLLVPKSPCYRARTYLVGAFVKWCNLDSQKLET
jgi:hypothetical protein